MNDFVRYWPPSWDHFIGNRRVKSYLQRLLRRLRVLVDRRGRIDATHPCLLLSGPSRSGKTAMVRFFVRCVICPNLDPTTLNPCDGRCGKCDPKKLLAGVSPWEVAVNDLETGKTTWVNYRPLDATHILTPAELRAELNLIHEYDGIRVVHIDEVHRLVNRHMDEMLLTALEEKPCLWIFSTAKPGGLEDMLKNRLLKLENELPGAEEMEEWVADRLVEAEVNYESEAIVRLVEKCNRVVGLALHAMAEAALDPETGLTMDLVEDWAPQTDD